MSDKKVRVPQIRFAGFAGDWEARKVVDLFKVTRGSVLAATITSEKKTEFSPYPVYSSQTKENGLMGYYKEFLYEDAITWTTDGANAGTVNYRTGKFYCTNVCGVLLTDEIKADQMIADALNSVAKKYVSYVGNPKLMNNVMANIEIQLPSQEKERELLSNLFTNLDNLITLQQRQLDKLASVKKTMLEKMFPKDGSNEPEIRFAGFTGAWEERKLGDVAEIVGGGTPSTTDKAYWGGVIDWYAPAEIGEQIFVKESQKKITELGLQKSSAKILPVGTVLFTSRAGIGNTAILAKEGATNQGFQSIIPHKDSLDSYFIFTRTHELKHYGETVGAGSTFVEVSGKQMAKMPIKIPRLIEQKKIGQYFASVDNLLTLHQRELNALKTLKKSMLQQLFV